MTIRLAGILVLVAMSCEKTPPAAPPPTDTTPDTGPTVSAALPPPPTAPTVIASAPPAPTSAGSCSGAKPDPTFVCAQACGPPGARIGDPPPGFVWADPRNVQGGKMGPCPRCLPGETLIATPSGDVRVDGVREGSIVWTTDRSGRRVAAPVLHVGATPLPRHPAVTLRLADGRIVRASPGHPLADGRLLGSLSSGQRVDGSIVMRAESVEVDGATYDLLPAGDTGTYWASSVLLRSTLTR